MGRLYDRTKKKDQKASRWNEGGDITEGSQGRGRNEGLTTKEPRRRQLPQEGGIKTLGQVPERPRVSASPSSSQEGAGRLLIDMVSGPMSLISRLYTLTSRVQANCRQLNVAQCWKLRTAVLAAARRSRVFSNASFFGTLSTYLLLLSYFPSLFFKSEK